MTNRPSQNRPERPAATELTDRENALVYLAAYFEKEDRRATGGPAFPPALPSPESLRKANLVLTIYEATLAELNQRDERLRKLFPPSSQAG
jgi:hypothetical protein